MKRQARQRLEGMFPENGFAHPEIPNAELGLWMIPSSKADYFPEICEFALTYDGYRHNGSTKACAETANSARDRFRKGGQLPAILDRLRSCLFFEQRRFHHFGTDPEGRDLEYIRGLVLAIRKKVQDKTRARAGG